MIRVYSQPVHESFLDAKTDTRACMIIGALHLYHIIAYQPLNSVDLASSSGRISPVNPTL